MKRWVILAGLVVALSSLATVAVNFLPETTATTTAPKSAVPVVPARRPEQPKAIVEGERVFDFGTLPQHTTGKHSWVVKNEGGGPLELWMISSTCSCTLAKFKNGERAKVGPGETTEITLEYETRANNGKYEKGAEIGTNDPGLAQFPLHVKGHVFPAILTVPPLDGNALNLLNISNENDHTNKMGIYSKDRPETKILKVTTSKPDDIVATWERMPAADLKNLGLTGADTLTFVIKPTMPLGNFREKIVVTTDHPLQADLELMIAGQMSGPVNFIPGQFRKRYPPVNGRIGDSGEMIISVRENRETKFEVVKTPKGITAEVLPTTNPPRKGRYRLVITIPKGTPSQDIEGEIELSSDHPKATKVMVPVSILVTDTEPATTQ